MHLSIAAVAGYLKNDLKLFVLALSSILNALYYLPAVINIWSDRRPDAVKAEKDVTATAAIILLACGVLFLGLRFTPVMDLIVRGLELM